jgi:HD-like signal output (HDOD) protein/ActR/RegA family two-component response regulator
VRQSILFVDDDLNLLQGLQRLLRAQRDHWDMVFLADPQAALALLPARSFDVVVSDMRMPGLDGAQFLAEVERRAPGSQRVILSGYAGDASLFRSVGAAHQYLAKPCDPNAIIALMDRARRLHRILGDARLREFVAGLHNLPSPPELYLRVTEAMGRDDVSSKAIAAIVAEDVAMTTGLLKVTNSSYFAVNSRVTKVSQAIGLLGLETVRTLALSHGIFRRSQDSPAQAEKLQKLNAHGHALGALAQFLARQDGAGETTQSEAYCAGLLANIGALILLDADAERYGAALDKIIELGFEPAERAAFGASHAEIGAYLLGLWGFSEVVVEAVFYQLHPSHCRNQTRCALTYMHLARAFGPPFPLLANPPPPRAILDGAYARRLGLAVETEAR